ncbi:ATP-grasp domain-containing protein [Candidatus Dojkabacteria bacterium]|uniref:ATP-grasp domain-containing protein n=1 Tax=Candidatus Dojkabacteria bacterium TaxID=2099670 RepID=A0A955I5P3_9BACT|nr:ATP-grasp domain-containing protein [Candidatus Dojkabacteria bacterium]
MHISNKINELDRLIQKDIPHIQTVVAKHINMRLSSEIESWGYPIVTKPFNGAKGKDVIRHDVEGSVATIFTNNEDFVLVQPFIPNDGDYRVFVMNKKILGCMKRTPPENDFRANVSIGGRAIAYEMTQDMIDLSQKVIEAFPEDFLGIDLIRHQQTGELYVMEVNHAPQFQGFMQATGIDMYDLMIKECVSLVR